jgi:hypothetical protein
MRVPGETYRFWQFSLPLLPAFDRAAWDATEDYLGPNGRFYRGTWTFFGKTRSVYSDELISFSKNEYAASASEVSDDR